MQDASKCNCQIGVSAMLLLWPFRLPLGIEGAVAEVGH